MKEECAGMRDQRQTPVEAADVSRREFMKTAALATGGVAVATAGAATAAVLMSRSRRGRLRIAS